MEFIYSIFIPVFIFKFAFFFLKKNFLYNFVYLFIFGCPVSLLLLKLFSSCGEQELLSTCGMQASHCGGYSCCGARASVVVILGL